MEVLLTLEVNLKFITILILLSFSLSQANDLWSSQIVDIQQAKTDDQLNDLFESYPQQFSFYDRDTVVKATMTSFIYTFTGDSICDQNDSRLVIEEDVLTKVCMIFPNNKVLCEMNIFLSLPEQDPCL